MSDIQSLSETKPQKKPFVTEAYRRFIIPIKLITIVFKTQSLPNDMFLFPFSLLYKLHTSLKIIFSKCAKGRVPFA